MGLSPLTGKKVKPSNNSCLCMIIYSTVIFYPLDKFNILAHENKKNLLEIKESNEINHY